MRVDNLNRITAFYDQQRMPQSAKGGQAGAAKDE